MFVWQCGVSLPNAWLRCLGGGAHRHRHTQHKNKHARIDTAAILMPRQQQCLLLDLSSNPKHGKQESPGLGWTFLTAHFGTIPKPSAAKHESPEIQPDIPKARGPHQARPQLPCTSPQQEAVGSDPEAGGEVPAVFPPRALHTDSSTETARSGRKFHHSTVECASRVCSIDSRSSIGNQGG